MYEQYYRLEGKPFQLSPDPRFFYPSSAHKRAMAYLRYGLEQGQGFIVVTGDVGTGKTMLVQHLTGELDPDEVAAARIVSTAVGETDLLRLLAAEFGLAYSRASKAVLLRKLEEHFAEERAQGRRVLLLIDEAQNLPLSSLEELRMLSNFERDGVPLVQSFLLGQREFRDKLRSPGVEQIRQRIIAAYHLKPLKESELRPYIEHRLKTVGWKKNPAISAAVYEGIYAATDGVPRRVNTLMDRLMLYAALEGRREIGELDLAAVLEEFEEERGPAAGAPAREPAPDRVSGAANGPVPGGGDGASADVSRLEARLAAMQRTMEQLAMQAAQAAAPPPPPPPPPPRPVWGIVFTATAVAVLIGGAAVLWLLVGR